MPDPSDGDESADAPSDSAVDSATTAGADASDGEPLHAAPDSADPSSQSVGDADDAIAAETGADRQSAVAALDDPDIEELLDEERRLESRVRILWVVRRLVPALVVGGVVGLAARWAQVATEPRVVVGIGAAVFALLVVYGAVRAFLLYRSWRYVVREDSLYLTRGVFTIVQTIVPYVRVQHIDTRRSAVERALGLASLVVYTAGSRGADVTIPGLTPERAERLQSRLKRLAIESEDEDAV